MDIVRKLQWWSTFLDIDIKYVVVLFAVVELLSPRTNSVNNFADFLPAGGCAIPLISFSLGQDIIEIGHLDHT